MDKKMKTALHTIGSLTLKYYRDLGYRIDNVEQYNAFIGQRKDFLGFIDYIAIKPGETIGIQSTTLDNKSARITKILELDTPLTWLEACNKIQIICWRKILLEKTFNHKSGSTFKRQVSTWSPVVLNLELVNGVLTPVEVHNEKRKAS